MGASRGVLTALLLPVHLSRSRLGELMAETMPGTRTDSPDAALRAGQAVLRGLARLRTPLWRNTCLYRSVLRCVLLRRAGIPAVVRIGARRRSDGLGNIAAHAWVEVDGVAVGDENSLGDFTPLRGREVDDSAAPEDSTPGFRSPPPRSARAGF